jgi:hypothetical protein
MSRRPLGRDAAGPYGTRIRVRFADPIPRSAENDPARILDRAREEIEETLLRWRKR